jgi:rubrerythrin
MSDTPWNLQDYKKAMRDRGRVIPLVEEVAKAEAAAKNGKRDTKHLHPSELAKKDWCSRAAVYKITGVEGGTDSTAFSTLNIFAEGNAIHEKWQTWLWKAGVLSGDWTCEDCRNRWSAVAPDTCPGCGGSRIRYSEVPIHNDEHRILGHADGTIVDKQGTALIEIKSVGVGTVRFEKPSLFMDYSKGVVSLDEMWKAIKTPFASHVRQGNLYMYCTGIHTIVFIYEWKPTQATKEFVVKYNSDIVDPILENCKSVIAHLDASTIPDRPEWAESSSSSGCKFCSYKKECWS